MFSRRCRTRLAILGALLLFLVPTTVRAQHYPVDGYVGVYFDRAGTQPCGNVPPFVPTTLYVLAWLEGATQYGITGVELRLEVSRSSGTIMSFRPDHNCTCIYLGNFLDSTACVGDVAGANFAFPECRIWDPIAGAGRVFLGTITLLDMGTVGPFTIVTKRRNPSSNPEFACPLFVLCDTPRYSQVCTALQDGDPRLGGLEPIAFQTVLNDSNCSLRPGCVVGVESHAWSFVKRLYRD